MLSTRRTGLVALALVFLLLSVLAQVVAPTPATAFPTGLLPGVAPGETWLVCQGYNNTSITHSGNLRYSLDLTAALNGAGSTGCTPATSNSTSNKPITAPGNGVVAWNDGSGFCINLDGGDSIKMYHVTGPGSGSRVSAGQVIGNVYPAGQGANGGYAHLHLAAYSGMSCPGANEVPFAGAARLACGAPDMTSNGSFNQWSGTQLTGSCGGGPSDQDADGVPDASDRCPTTVGPAAMSGCPDSDGDLRADIDDLCPYTYGTANQGCLQPFSTGPVGRDLNGDKRADLLAMYNYSTSESAIWAWYGQQDGRLGQERQVWHTPTGWDATRTLPVGVGDLTGDGLADVVVMYRYDPDFIKIWVWPGRADGGLDAPRIVWDAQKWWSGDRTVPIGLADINSDGRLDVLAYYRYDAGVTKIWAWLNNASGGVSNPQVVWEVPSGWDATRVIPAGLGDIDGDGRRDVLAYYRYDNGQLALWMWPGTGATTFPSAHQAWQTPTGWDGYRVRPAGVGDFNGDGRADIVAFYRYEPDWVNLWRWNGNANGTTGPGEVAWHVDKWWDGQRNTPIGVADTNGDRVPDVHAFYRYDNGQAKIWTWRGDGAGGVASPVETWAVPSGWDVNRIVPLGFARSIQVPSAPRSVTATAGSASATVTWTPPGDSGGGPITGYRLSTTGGSQVCETAGLGCTVTGLANGVGYAFVVRAVNAAGAGPASAPSAVVVPATVPGQVRAVKAAYPARGKARITWLAPVVDGGRALAGYQLRMRSASATTWGRWASTGLVRTKLLTGLARSRSYVVQVRALNPRGPGAVSVIRIRNTK